MLKTRNFINRLSKTQKVTFVVLILVFVILFSIGIPTLARYKNRSINTISVWDGSIASSYRKGNGSASNPYIISNGSELAYFYTQLSNNNYDNTYFALSNDIVLNKGIFNYDSDNGVKYILDNQTYYVGYYSNKYYSSVNRNETEVGTINVFNSLDGFKGNFDGGSFRIYGLYVTDQSNDEVALFTNLQGNVENLYVENSVVYGGVVTAGIASTTNNASLSNILFNGYVVGKSTELTKNINTIPTVPVINLQNSEVTNYIDLTNNVPFVGSEIVSTSITGNYVINGADGTEVSIKINGVPVSNGSFELDLGSSILKSISVLTSTTSDDEATLTFSNLKYDIVYKYAVSGGIVASSDNTKLENIINKADIYGYSTSGGLVGVTTSILNINQSYNVGNVNAKHVAGGLVGTIEKSSNNIVISKSYNTGDMTAVNIGGLIGIANDNTGSVSLNNVFNTSATNYSIGTISDTTVNVTNAYFVNGVRAVNDGTINGAFASTSLNNIKTKSYIINNLSFNEFIDFDNLEINSKNVWVYENDSLPILFIDDINNQVANIHVNVYSWNNLSYQLRPVSLESNITFSIEAADDLVPLKEVYYYISKSSTALTKEEISQIDSWNPYNNIVQVSEEGLYVIYVKVVDYNDNVTYINTDLLVLDLSGSTVSASLDGNTWSDLRNNLNYTYIDRPKYVTVEASDNVSGIASVKYYITDKILKTNDLNELNNSSWTTYSDGILISDIGNHIVYIKVTDNFNHVTYVNTDYITLNGYTENSLTVGRNSNYLDESTYITDKSVISLNISYSDSSATQTSDYNHNLMSNILLPKGSKLTLIDHVTNKVYEYQITTDKDIYNYSNSCDVSDPDCIKKATYPFTLFKEIGTGSTSKKFVESDYYNNGVIDENFTIVLDLSDTDIKTNYNNVVLYMELHDSNNISLRPTLYKTIKEFNIYFNVSGNDASGTLYLTTNYSGNEITYNSDSLTNINITSGINYKNVNGFKIIDTTYEDKEIGLSIKMVDSDGNIIDRKHLKNIIFKVGDNEYYPEKDNIVRINLKSGITDVTKDITIITCSNNSDLNDGIYYFKISNYASYDGHYYDQLSNAEISVPVKVLSNESNIKYGFDVIIDDANRIINKTDENVKVSFNILQNGSLKSPNIRVSLYKKDQLTAYNQDYSSVNLSDYVNDDLNLFAGNIYYVSTNPINYDKSKKSYNSFELNLITANFENTGYKYVFELYDSNKKVGTIVKHFIVK